MPCCYQDNNEAPKVMIRNRFRPNTVFNPFAALRLTMLLRIHDFWCVSINSPTQVIISVLSSLPTSRCPYQAPTRARWMSSPSWYLHLFIHHQPRSSGGSSSVQYKRQSLRISLVNLFLKVFCSNFFSSRFALTLFLGYNGLHPF